MPELGGIGSFFRKAKKLAARHPRYVIAIVFLITWIIASYIWFLRFPNNYQYPNFYAEDGLEFTLAIQNKGFLGAMMQAFNGYFIWGLYLLTKLGFIFNAVFYDNQLAGLPRAFSIISYAFLGLCSAAPVLLLRKYLPLVYLVMAAAVITFVPLPAADFTTIGTIGNLKFVFAYLAILLALYRITLKRTSKKIFAVDGALFLCLYTIATSYLALPLLLIADGLRPKQLLSKSFWQLQNIRGNYSFLSALCLGLLGLIQIIFAATHGASTSLVGASYKSDATVEIFAARTILYPLVSKFYEHMTNWQALAGVTVLLAIALVVSYLRRNYYALVFFAAAAMVTLTLMVTRPELSRVFNGFQTSGHDNFYYTQNFLSVVGIILVLRLLATLLTKREYLRVLAVGACSGLIILGSVQLMQSRPANDFMQRDVGTVHDQIKQSCKDQQGYDIVNISVYPFRTLRLPEPRQLICND